MTRKTILVAGLLGLTSTHMQANTGTFVIGPEVGRAEHIGGVARGAQVVLSITAKQIGLDLSCPMKVTLAFVADNNRSRVVKRVFRRNAMDSQVMMTAPISSELVAFFQTQNLNHFCGFTFGVDADTIPLALGLNQTSQDGADSNFEDNIPPELAMPVNPIAARQTGLP